MDMRDLERAARRQGWTVNRTTRGHVYFTSPTGERVYTSGTSGDRKAIRNFVAALRRAGFQWPPPGKGER